jgi:hypothetical protein
VRGLEERIGQVGDKLDEVERSIDVMGRNVSKDIYSAVRRATSHLVKQAAEKDGPNGGGSGIMSEEMKMIMGRKADKNEIEGLITLKANKCDAELAFKWLDLVHKQLK